jgi:hypothetical protein
MPTEHCGFKLKPSGFFSSSPAMDVPDLQLKSKCNMKCTNINGEAGL